MLIHKNVFNLVGIMDEKYFVYFDDSDFSLRLNKKGIKIYYNYIASIEHKESTSTGGYRSPFHIYYFNRNILYYIRKNFNVFYQFCVIIFLLIHFLTRKIFIYSNAELKIVYKATIDGLKLSKEI